MTQLVCLDCRERAAGMYGVIPYAVAQGAVEFPWALAQSIVYSVITYFMIQFEFSAGETPALHPHTLLWQPMSHPCTG